MAKAIAKARIRLVTRGDDAASCNTANVAIWNAYRKGILRNAGVMVPAPAFEETAEMFSGEKGLCVGLHATLNSEWDLVRWRPVLPREKVLTLLDEEGCFHRNMMTLHERKANHDEMMAEVQAQLDLARARGLNIQYLDAHCGFDWMVKAEMRELAEREGLVYAPAGVSHLPRREGSFADPIETLMARLEAAEPGTYILVGHPCYDRVDVRLFTQKGRELSEGTNRDWQRRIFMDQKVLDYCRKKGVEPIRYDEI